MKKYCYVLAVLPIVFSGVAVAQQPSQRAASAKASSQAADARTAAVLISRYRAANGLGPVRVDGRLNASAAQQARTIAQSGSLDHGDFAGRMAASGIRGKAAENLSLGLGSVEQVIAQWQASSGHNANLLMPEFSRIGLARTDNGRPYWVLVLAK